MIKPQPTQRDERYHAMRRLRQLQRDLRNWLRLRPDLSVPTDRRRLLAQGTRAARDSVTQTESHATARCVRRRAIRWVLLALVVVATTHPQDYGPLLARSRSSLALARGM